MLPLLLFKNAAPQVPGGTSYATILGIVTTQILVFERGFIFINIILPLLLKRAFIAQTTNHTHSVRHMHISHKTESRRQGKAEVFLFLKREARQKVNNAIRYFLQLQYIIVVVFYEEIF